MEKIHIIFLLKYISVKSKQSIKNIVYQKQFNNKQIDKPLKILDVYLKLNEIQLNGYLQAIQIMYQSMDEEQIQEFESLDSLVIANYKTFKYVKYML